MALTIRHAFVSTKQDGPDSSLVRSSNWNADHQITGTLDETTLALSDVTTANATTGHHGFLKKLPNDNTLFMDGTGNWTAPSHSASEVNLSFTDILTANTSTSKHGLAPKLSGTASQYLDGTGNWTTPAGSGGGESVWSTGEGSVFVEGANVGIGESDPQAPLHITTDTGTSTLGTGIRINSVTGSTGNGAKILWTNNGDVLNLAAITGMDDGNWGGALVMYTSPQTGNSPGGALTERFRIDHTGAITFNQAYTFPTADGQPSQILVTNGDGSLSWNDPTSDTAITETNTDLRLLVDLTDPSFNGPKLRIYRFAGVYQGSSQSRGTVWFDPPTLHLSESSQMPSAGQSLSYYAYYFISNATLNTSTSGIVKGRIEYVTSNTALEVSADTNGGTLRLTDLSGASLTLGCNGTFDHPDSHITITIHYIGEAFTSPEFWC